MNKVTKKWTTADGSKVRICDMIDSHLLNTIRFVERTHEKHLMAALGTAAMVTAEIATDCAERQVERLEEGGPAETLELYDGLVLEAQRRGLKA